MRRQARPALSAMAATSHTCARECGCACVRVLCREDACSMCAVKAGRNEAGAVQGEPQTQGNNQSLGYTAGPDAGPEPSRVPETSQLSLPVAIPTLQRRRLRLQRAVMAAQSHSVGVGPEPLTTTLQVAQLEHSPGADRGSGRPRAWGAQGQGGPGLARGGHLGRCWLLQTRAPALC